MLPLLKSPNLRQADYMSLNSRHLTSGISYVHYLLKLSYAN